MHLHFRPFRQRGHGDSNHGLRPGVFFLSAIGVAALSAGLSGCKSMRKAVAPEDVYVTAKQAYLRDRVAAVSNRTGEVTNGEKLTVLGRQRRFLRVRTPSGAEGWIEEKLTADQAIADQFEALRQEHLHDQVIVSAVTRDEVYLHAAPGRETVHFFRLAENEPLSLLGRATVPKPAAPGASTAPVKPSAARLPTHQSGFARTKAEEPSSTDGESAASAPPETVLEDWWLVRDNKGETGWIYGHMIDVTAPDALVRYAEGQRIVGAYVLAHVEDPESGIVNNGQAVTSIPEYVTVLSPYKSGLPYDFDQIRVFTWNVKKHRYETAFRERDIAGYLPVQIAMKTDPYNKDAHFAQPLPTFIAKLLPADVPMPAPDPTTGLVKPARTVNEAIRLEGNICRRIAPAGAPPPALAHPIPEPEKGAKLKGKHRR